MNPILAIDFGRARIGVAVSDELQLLAHPLEISFVRHRLDQQIGECPHERIDSIGREAGSLSVKIRGERLSTTILRDRR